MGNGGRTRVGFRLKISYIWWVTHMARPCHVISLSLMIGLLLASACLTESDFTSASLNKLIGSGYIL